MTDRKQKLELTWIGKEVRPRLEPRILLEDVGKSYHATHRVDELDIFDNRLIFGDNLLALKALETEFEGAIKCIYIDPPFNTQQAFEYYDDGVEHSIWLSLIRDRLELLHRLLSRDGTLFIHIDDNELGYLIVLADEIFGRRNRVYVVTFKQSSVSGPKAVNPGLVTIHSTILVYAKDKTRWAPAKVHVPTRRDARYNRYIANIDAPYCEWVLVPLRDAFAHSENCAAAELKARFSSTEELEARLESFVLADPRRVVRTARIAPGDVNESCRAVLQESKRVPRRVFRLFTDLSARPDAGSGRGRSRYGWGWRWPIAA